MHLEGTLRPRREEQCKHNEHYNETCEHEWNESATLFQPPGVPGERTAASPDGAPDAPPPAAVTTGHAQDRKRRGEGQRSNMFCRTRKWFQGRTLISHTDCTSAVLVKDSFTASWGNTQRVNHWKYCSSVFYLMCPSCLATVGLCFRGVNGCLMRAGLRKLDQQLVVVS